MHDKPLTPRQQALVTKRVSQSLVALGFSPGTAFGRTYLWSQVTPDLRLCVFLPSRSDSSWEVRFAPPGGQPLIAGSLSFSSRWSSPANVMEAVLRQCYWSGQNAESKSCQRVRDQIKATIIEALNRI